MMRRSALTLILLLASFVFGQELDVFVASHGHHFLGISQETLLRGLNLRSMTWNNAERTQMRYYDKMSNEKFTFGDQQITEALFSFSQQKRLVAVQVSMYNRGDCGEWPKEKFNGLLKTLQARIGEITRVRTPETSNRIIGGNETRQMLWRTPGHDMALRWSRGDRGPEYITINIEPRGSIQKLGQDIKTSVKAGELAGNVKREPHGVRWIDVPMVNQGDKGYCVVAVMGRLMTYYNSSMDQHMVAQLMEADASHGTDVVAGMNALKSCEHKLRIKVKELYSNKAFQSMSEFENMLGDYNRAAKKAGLPKVDIQQVRNSDNRVRAAFGVVDKGVYMAMRKNVRPGPERFFMTVKDSIDRGIPLAWMVVILPGELREQPTASLHARLINGYNPSTNEIIYTDTWGPGHERKTMKAEEAWAVSNMILSIRPQ